MLFAIAFLIISQCQLFFKYQDFFVFCGKCFLTGPGSCGILIPNGINGINFTTEVAQ